MTNTDEIFKPSYYKGIDPFIFHGISVPLLIREFQCRRVAEVGVEKGFLTEKVLKECSDQLLEYYLIDPWRPFGGTGAGWYFNQPRFQEWLVWDDLCHFVYQHFTDRTTIIRLPSLVAVTLFESESLDFVFIDADHSYEAVRDDIKAWLPKVTGMGVLAGHDYGGKEFPGVAEAVDEVFSSAVHTAPGTVWFVVKQELC